MNQNKNTQGQPGQGNQGQPNQGQRQGSQGDQNFNRDQAEGSREQTRGGQSTGNQKPKPNPKPNPKTGNRGNMGGQERGTGSQGERNSSGISNRGMSESDEQADLPDRGSSDEDDFDQSDR